MKTIDQISLFAGIETWILLFSAVWFSNADIPLKLFASACLTFVVVIVALIYSGGELLTFQEHQDRREKALLLLLEEYKKRYLPKEAILPTKIDPFGGKGETDSV
jgi:hypothetical protein